MNKDVGVNKRKYIIANIIGLTILPIKNPIYIQNLLNGNSILSLIVVIKNNMNANEYKK